MISETTAHQVWVGLYAAAIPTILVEVGRRVVAKGLRVSRRRAYPENRLGASGNDRKERATGLESERRADWRGHGTTWTLVAIGLLAGFSLSRNWDASSVAGNSFSFGDVGRITVVLVLAGIWLLHKQYEMVAEAPRVIPEAARKITIVNALGVAAFATVLAGIILEYRHHTAGQTDPIQPSAAIDGGRHESSTSVGVSVPGDVPGIPAR